MNFSSHIKKRREELRACLSGKKKTMLPKLSTTIEGVQTLLKSNALDFWIVQMITTPPEEIPMTTFGLKFARHYLDVKLDESEHSRYILASEAARVCVNLLTYMKDGDDCPMQSDFHYYFDEVQGLVFKESELGYSTLPAMVNLSIRPQVRIARVSELELDPVELVP